jgi:MSHA biogenesis protein MshL
MNQRLDKLKCPDGRSFFLNAQSGVVMVRAMPMELREVERLLKAMQANIERQVMLEAKIIDVQLNDDYQSGINWSAFNKNGGNTWSMNGNTDAYVFPGGRPVTTIDANGNTISATLTGAAGIMKTFPVAGALGLAFQSQNFASLISFLQTQGTVYVMSSPRIATINNQKAVIKVGSDDYYITSVTPSSSISSGTTGTVTNPPSITAQPFFSGISLDVTPQIDESGSITLHIRPSITDVSEKTKTVDFGDKIYKLPYASTKVKESDSIVRVRDGMIVAIGGMMTEGQTDTANKVPGAGDVPGVGNFFKQTGRTMNKRELVILLKPTLIQEDADWQQDLLDTEERLQEYDPKKFRKAADAFKQ